MANQYRSVLSGGTGTGGNAIASEVLSGKTFTNDNGAQTGTMTNNGAVSGVATPSTPYTIPAGFHNGLGSVIASSDLASGEIYCLNGDGTVTHANGTITTGSNNFAVFGVIGSNTSLLCSGAYGKWATIKEDGSIVNKGDTPYQAASLASDELYFIAWMAGTGSPYTFTLS